MKPSAIVLTLCIRKRNEVLLQDRIQIDPEFNFPIFPIHTLKPFISASKRSHPTMVSKVAVLSVLALMLASPLFGQTARQRVGAYVGGPVAMPEAIAILPLPYHPFRKVGERYYDLRPLYSWIGAASHRTPKPIKDWFGGGIDGPIFAHYRVIQVAEDGLLVREERSSLYDDPSDPFFLKNYPNFKNLTDHQEIRFLALRTGNYRYVNAFKEAVTVPCYDYGLPYDPWAVQKAMQSTNLAASGSSPKVLQSRQAIGNQAEALP